MKLRQGTHYQVLISELSREKTAEVMAALKSLEVLHFLGGNPIPGLPLGASIR
jgi:hypothetical protein